MEELIILSKQLMIINKANVSLEYDSFGVYIYGKYTLIWTSCEGLT